MCIAGVHHFTGVSLATFATGRHYYAGRATRQALPHVSSKYSY